MTVSTTLLGKPRHATRRGGDCWAHDLRPNPITGEPHPITERPHIHGAGHTLRLPEHCAIQNGLLRLFVLPGSPPSLSWQVYRGRVVIDDFYVDTYVDLYGGAYSSPEWFDAGVITIDSPDVAAVLTGVRLIDVNAEKVTIKLLAPLIGDAYVSLHRGWRSVRIQHGDPRSPVTVERRISLADSPSPVGMEALGRVEEYPPAVQGLHRFVAATVPVTADAVTFSVTADAAVTADFGAGVGTVAHRDRAYNLHQQLGDASRPLLLVTEPIDTDDDTPGSYGSYEGGY